MNWGKKEVHMEGFTEGFLIVDIFMLKNLNNES